MGIATRGRLLWAAVLATSAAAAVADCGAGCGDSLAGTPADEFVAERLGLVREWVVQLPIDSAGSELEHLVIGDGLVVGQSGDGGVHAVRAAPLATPAAPQAKGKEAEGAKPDARQPAGPQAGEPQAGGLLWSRRLGQPGSLATLPGVGPHLVTVTRDRELFAIDRHTGDVVWQRPLGAVPNSGALEVADWVYVPLVGAGIRRLVSNPLQPTAESARSSGAAAGGPAVAANLPSEKSLRPRTFTAGGVLQQHMHPLADGICWITAEGMLVALEPTLLDWERFQFSYHTPIVDMPAIQENGIYVATRGADLARVDFRKTGIRGLRTVWHVVLDALAVAGDRAWIRDATGRLAGIDLASGERRERICLAGFTFPVVNTESERLLLASPEGLLVSLAPRRPTARQPQAQKPPTKKPAKKPPQAEDEAT